MTFQKHFDQLIHICLVISVAGTSFLFDVPTIAANETSATKKDDCPRVVLNEKVTVNVLAMNTISQKESHPLFRAMSLLWMKKDISKANKILIQEFKRLRGDTKTLTPEIADIEFKWQMRIWIRIYGLFNSRNGWFPGRLKPEAEAVFHKLFWNYAFKKSTINRAGKEFMWFIQGSENHDLMDLSNAFLALEALQHVPEYQKRLLTDGHTIDEHVKAWTNYYCQYADERVARGLLIECGSCIYGKYFIPEIVNMADFSSNAILRKKMTMFLDVLWADWAIEQIDGIRGGGKSRVYQGRYSQQGTSDSYLNMGQILLGLGKWPHKKHKHTNSGFVYCLAMSRYRLPVVVAQLAINRPKNSYISISRRPAKMTGVKKLPNNLPHPNWYIMDPNDTRAMRYSYCTSDYIMGSWWVDASFGASSIVKEGNDQTGNANYAAIHAQNRWQGIIFRGDPNARIYPQCFSTKIDKNDNSKSVTMHQQIALQHKNLMIVQANLKRKRTKSMHIYFAPSIRKNLMEFKGWLVAQVGHVFVATTAIDSKANFVGGQWKHENTFQLDDLTAPVIMVTSGNNKFHSINDFKKHLETIDFTTVENVLNIRFHDADNQLTDLKFDCTQKTLPSVNGKTINFNPEVVYHSPYLSSKFGSGIVTIRKDKNAYIWNMNDNSIRKKNR